MLVAARSVDPVFARGSGSGGRVGGCLRRGSVRAWAIALLVAVEANGIGPTIRIMMMRPKESGDQKKRSGPLYEIGRPVGECGATGREIAPGEVFVATLCESEEEREDGTARSYFHRVDFSVNAWESGSRPERLVFYWRTAMPQPNEKRNPFVDDEILMNLFERLEGDDDAQRLAYRFVLGLILMRKKQLRCVRTEVKANESIWFMRRQGDPPEAPLIEMIDPQLADDRVREVADHLGEVFCEDFK